MLHGEGQQQQGSTQEEGRIDAQRQPGVDEVEIGDGDDPGVDRRICGKETDQDVAGGNAGADGKHRRPGKPIAPHRKRPEDLAVAHPGRGTIDGRAPGFVREHARDLGIGERLDEAHDDGQGPDDVGGRADGGGDAADGEQHQRRHAAGDPECLLPVDRAVKCPLAGVANRSHWSTPPDEFSAGPPASALGGAGPGFLRLDPAPAGCKPKPQTQIARRERPGGKFLGSDVRIDEARPPGKSAARDGQRGRQGIQAAGGTTNSSSSPPFPCRAVIYKPPAPSRATTMTSQLRPIGPRLGAEAPIDTRISAVIGIELVAARLMRRLNAGPMPAALSSTR